MRLPSAAKYVLIAAAIVVTSVVSLFVGDTYALNHLTVKRASVDQLSKAMEQDRFYSDYRESTLYVAGTVKSVKAEHGDLVVSFQTNLRFGVLCDLGKAQTSVRVTNPITVVAEGMAAERQSSAVMLRGCLLG